MGSQTMLDLTDENVIVAPVDDVRAVLCDEDWWHARIPGARLRCIDDRGPLGKRWAVDRDPAPYRACHSASRRPASRLAALSSLDVRPSMPSLLRLASRAQGTARLPSNRRDTVLVGSAEVWLEEWFDAVVVHVFWQVDRADGKPLRPRERRRYAVAVKRHVMALKDTLERGRAPGTPRATRVGE